MGYIIDRHFLRRTLDGRRIENTDGGKGSGNFGHKGRPGLRGGSGKGGGKAFRTTEEGSASGYVGIQRAKAFKAITEHAKKCKDANTFIDTMTDDQWKQVTDQRKACGTKEDNLAYAERLYKMLITTTADLHYQKPRVVQGKDITSTWKRQSNKFQHEINDVIHAQGFDGVPKIVSKAEFDKAVKAANGGKGFLAQRTYSASTEPELKGFRDQLYHGEWYVACTTGGAQYGQGMYCAADYNGELSDGIKTEMVHYIDQYSRLSTEKIDRSEWVERATDSAIRTLSVSVDSDTRRWIKKNGDLVRQYAEAFYDDTNVVAVAQKIPSAQRTRIKTIFYGTEMNKPQPHNVETFTLDPSAKVITYDDLWQKYHEYQGQFDHTALMDEARDEVYTELHIGLEQETEMRGLLYQYSRARGDQQAMELVKKRAAAKGYNFDKNDNDPQKSLLALRKLIDERYEQKRQKYVHDIGAYAALLGYDAINAEGHGQSDSYTVVLNRTKCIFLDPDDPAGEEYWGYSKVS